MSIAPEHSETQVLPHNSKIYAPLGPSDIRVVDILPSPQFDVPLRIRIRTVSLENDPRYTALSYVWNPQDGTIDPSSPPERVAVVSHEQSELTAGPNLAAAMRQLRRDNAVRTIWIDALSINQSSDNERSHQVGLMGKIYASADAVYIWLGPEKDGSDLATNIISTNKFEDWLLMQFLDALELLLNRDWFGRVWVAQELALAWRDPTVLCGSSTVRWSRFSATIQEIRNRTLAKQDASGNEANIGPLLKTSDVAFNSGLMNSQLIARIGASRWGGTIFRGVASKAIRICNLARIRETWKHATLAEQIHSTLYMRATDPRDRIFALSALTGSSNQRVIADYTKPKEQVATEVAAHLIKEDFLGYMATRLWEHNWYTVGLTSHYFKPIGSTTTGEVPSFSTDLDALGIRTLDDRFVPPGELISLLLRASRGTLPIVDFADDCRKMMTLGYDMGHVTKEDLSSGRFETSRGYCGFSPLRVHTRYRVILVGLFGINAPFLLRQTQTNPASYRILAYVKMASAAETAMSFSDKATTSTHEWGHPFLTRAALIHASLGEKFPSRYSTEIQDLRRWEHMKWYDSLRESPEADRFDMYVIT